MAAARTPPVLSRSQYIGFVTRNFRMQWVYHLSKSEERNCTMVRLLHKLDEGVLHRLGHARATLDLPSHVGHLLALHAGVPPYERLAERLRHDRIILKCGQSFLEGSRNGCRPIILLRRQRQLLVEAIEAAKEAEEAAAAASN